MGLSLAKKSELVGLQLAKHNVPSGISLRVKCMIDVSGSIAPLFNDGTMSELFDRLIPVAMRFDDDKSIEAYAFGSKAAKVDDIKESDFSNNNYISRFKNQAENADILWTGTKYSKALELLAKPEKASGLFGGMFSKSVESSPTYVLFITDGDTQGDERETRKLLEKMAGTKVYIQFVGVGRGSRFAFLKEMADEFDHVGLVSFPDLGTTSDETMYQALLSSEPCAWFKSVK